MFNAGNHIIHLTNGQLSPLATTRPEDVAHLVSQALASNAPSGIVVHFHGGLISHNKARSNIERTLYPLYADRASAYPIFFVWESGFFDAIRNNLEEIRYEDLFQEFVKKVTEWMLKKLPAGIGFKGGSGASINEPVLREDFDAWFRGDRSSPPEQLEREPGVTAASMAAKSKGASIDQDVLEIEITESIEGDADFQDAVHAVYNGLYPAGQGRPVTRGTGISVAENSLISKEATDKLFEAKEGTTKGFGPFTWFKIAKVVAVVVVRGIRRLQNGRAHGMYTTVVEETLRELYLDKIGRQIWWDMMKKDTADAFKDGPQYGGTAFLAELQRQLPGIESPPKITLVGHSAGAIYVCNFLKAASRWLPDFQWDVIFEAPAVTHTMLAETIARHAANIRHFRQFGLGDEREAGDVLAPIIYLRSLLYFVSGLLESEIDEPLAGMERYLKETAVYTAQSFPNIEICRRFYAGYPNSLVWAPSRLGPGYDCECTRHGDFDDVDEATMRSMQHILQNGY